MMIFQHRSLVGPHGFRWFGTLALVAFLSGCDSGDAPKKVQVYPVKGQVLLPDGKPLAAGRIIFVSKDGLSSSSGTISSDGTFTLTTGDSGEGAPPGEYRVRLEPDWTTQPKAAAKPARPDAALPFPPKYADEDASGLTATIKAEPNNLEPFKLNSTPAKSETKPVSRD